MKDADGGRRGAPAAAAVPAVSETTPLLPRRGDSGALPPRDCGEGPLFFVHAPLAPLDDQGRPPAEQLIRYNIRTVSSVLSLLQFRGTAFASWGIWLHALAYAAVAASACALVFFGTRRPELINTERMSELVSYSSALVGLLLVLHLGMALRRWWSLRLGTLGALWGASCDLSMLLAAHLPQPGGAEAKALVVRYCLASLELAFMQAQGTDGVLGSLVRQQLLTDDEKRKLEDLVSKPQSMWVWIAGIFQRLAEQGKLSSRLLVSVYRVCAKARAAVGRGHGAFAYVDTQLPLPYVHLLAVLVHLNSLAIAVKGGVLSAVAIWNLQRPEDNLAVSDAESIQVLVLQGVFVIWAPALYHAVLQEVARLGDPFRDRFHDFPRRAYQVWLRSECEALLAAGTQPPQEALQVTEEFEVREGDLPQDCVAAV